MVIGANPTDAHPVFASHMKKRLREGARLIVVDPRRIDLVKSAHVQADYHLPLLPGSNVAVINAFAHVIVTEGLVDEPFVQERCEPEAFEQWRKFVAEERNSPEATEAISGVPAADLRAAARLYATGGNAAIYYGLGVTEHSQGSTMVMGMANLAMATGNIGKRGVGVNPLRGQNNVQGACDMGSFPHEFSGYRHVSDDAARLVRRGLACAAAKRARTAHLQHAGRRLRRHLQGHLYRGRRHRPIRSQHAARDRRDDRDGMRGGPGSFPE
jgi:formate dehydrogenase major subunit